MYATITRMFEEFADASTRGDARGVTEFYGHQFPVFSQNRVYLLEGREAQEQCFLTHRDQLDRMGLRGYRAIVAAVGLPRGPQVQVHVDLALDFGPDEAERVDARTYYLRRSKAGQGFQIEMLSFRAIGVPHYAQWHRQFLVAGPSAPVAG